MDGPATGTFAIGAFTDLTRSRSDLIAENALLRQQLRVLNRQVKRQRLMDGDRLREELLARCTWFWKQAHHIVQPETLLRWHRDLFRLYWRWKSKPKKRKPQISSETIDLALLFEKRPSNLQKLGRVDTIYQQIAWGHG